MSKTSGSIEKAPATSSIAQESCRETLLDNLEAAVWIFDIDHGRIVWANRSALDVWATDSLEELKARNMKADMSPSVERRLKQYQADFIARGATFTEAWTLYPHGVPRPLHVNFTGTTLADGRMGMMCEARDSADQPPETLRSSDALLHTKMMISLHEDSGETLYMNPAARNAFQTGQADLRERFVRTQDYEALVSEVGRARETSIIARMYTAHGERWHELTARACHDPVSGSPSLLISSTDVSNLKEAEARARVQAHTDPLTELPNRLSLQSVFARMTKKARRKNQSVGVLFIDLDQFKSINDTLGHNYGDTMLIRVANRLSSLCEADEVVARLGGDEFLFLMSVDNNRLELLTDRANAILGDLSLPVSFQGRKLSVTPSIGIAHFPKDGHSIQDLMQCADLAMYAAKAEGRNRYKIFDSHMRDQVESELEILTEIRDGLASNQFTVYFQPRISAATGKLCGVEALVRWNHPTRGLQAPNAFIPLCEKNGLIEQLGAVVMQKTLAQLTEWRNLGHNIRASINVSHRQLIDPEFATSVQQLLHTHDCPPEQVELEITETLYVEADQIVRTNIEKARAHGVRIALDDFGTGYSNFERLSQMAVDCIKIDRSLVDPLPKNEPIVRMMIGMCQLMKVNIVAEGIESEAVSRIVTSLGCNELQGYYHGRPMPAEQLTELLVSQSKTSGLNTLDVIPANRKAS